MTQSYLNYIVLLLSTLFLLTNCYGTIKSIQSDSNFYELQCNKSTNTTRYEYELYCGINSTVWVKFNAQDFDDTFVRYSDVQFNCYNANPLNIRLPLKANIEETADRVLFNSCRFSAKDNILNILRNSLHLIKIKTVAFDNELIDNFLSTAHLKPLNGFVEELSFKIKNLSTLPMDLFGDVKNLNKLSISSNSINTSHLTGLLAPLKKLGNMILETNSVENLSASIFADKQFLHSLELRNATILSSSLLSHLSGLENIYLRQNNFSSLPKDLFRETKKLTQFLLGENRVALKQLPEGLLSNLSFLFSVLINDCGLESIPFDIFKGSKSIKYITITGNNLQELPLPLGLFVDQERLISLDLSRNMIRTLVVGLFNQTKSLKKLILSDNQLTNLPDNIFRSLTHLEQLSLENNNLLTISSDSDKNQPQLASIFDNFSYLKRLYLKNNSISEIPLNIMINKKYLMNIDLRFNKISSIDCSFLKYFDSKINITENPLNCDYKIICLYQYIIQKSLREKFKFRSIRCGLPSTLKGRLLYDLELSQILRFPADIDEGNDSNRCSSNIRPLDSVLVMNCSDRNLSDIPTLPMPDQSFSNGIELFMHNNPLTELSSYIPKDNTNITLISISDSPIFELPKGFFSNMTKLKNVSLVLPLNKISEDIFLESTGIEFLKISGTNLTSLPKSLFANQQNLTELDLSSNRLNTLSLGGFKSNRELETLKLSHNFLEYLSTAMFYELLKLKSLFLDNNSLKHVHAAVFLYTRSLEVLNMENNMLLGFEPLNTTLGALQKLLLRSNLIKDCNWLGFQDFTPAFVDLSLNKISSIDLSYLGSINLKKTVLNLTGNDIETIKVPYGNISLKCDCKIDSLIIDTKQKSIYDSLRCLASDNQKDRRVSYLPQEELLCPINSVCPEACSCWIHPANSTLIVDCFNASLTEVPPLPELNMTFKGGIELSIEHNQLTSLKTHSKSGYKDVTKMYAAHNKITNISSEDIGESLNYLDLSYNKLERLYERVLKVINDSQNLRSVLLYKNPLKCDCLSENLTRFILTNKRLFPDIDQCEDGRKFIDLSYYTVCSEEQSNLDKVIGTALIIILAALFVLTILYFNNKERILIWMYAHNICLWCVTEEELDKDKKYDAFISYSSYDGEFIAKNLVSKLESGPKPYKLCLHDRDWLGGGYIPNQIEKSVERSKRTLIVMSKNYLKSKWTRYEFRTAHNASLNEKRPRVIVIMIEDDVKIENLDSDLRKYIKMYTYLKLDDPLFWDRLCYALPHPSKKNNKQSKQNNNKVKIMKNFGADAEEDYSLDGINLF